jgi:thiol-disulfide isomerase/thioredoxin
MAFAARVRSIVGCLVVLSPFLLASARAASPKAEQALQLTPVQKNVDFDRPAAGEAAKCKISAQKVAGNVGWVVESPEGMVLRQFVDTNGDNVVDQWNYFKDGLEVYRDVDSDFNGKADQYRWFHTAGSRWGVDKNEDGQIDAWKSISAEEVTAEVVAALAGRDVQRFLRVALSDAELESLGLGAAKTKQLAEQLRALPKEFEDLAARQKQLTTATTWVQFSGNQPGIVPAGTDGSTRDLRVYENVVAIVRTGDEHGQVPIGTLVEVGDGWRVIDVPQPVSAGQGPLTSSGFFFRSPFESRTEVSDSGPSEQTQELLAQLEKLDTAAEQAASAPERARVHAQRADLLEQVADEAAGPSDRAMWLRQLADVVSAAVQSGEYPDGVKRLDALMKKLSQSGEDKDLAAYVRFRQLMADYGLSMQTASTEEFVKIQTAWLKQLEDYVDEYPKSPDAAEAMLQLAIAQEYAGEEPDAKKWYGRVVSECPTAPSAKKAAGALTRLESVGKTLSLQGQSAAGGEVDLAKYRGKVVVIQFWASWCEPCKADMATLKELLAKYGPSRLGIIGVNVDSNREDMAAYVNESRIPWPQIYEEGGLDSRPANELGILTLPTMLLVDQQGKVVNRNVHVVELDRELKTLIR